MKRIKIKFVDFWEGFDFENNFIINSLRKQYDVELSDQPEYVFASVFGNDFLNYDCIRIQFTGENIVPDFSFFDYALGFEYMTYEDRYLRYPLYAVTELYGNVCKLMSTKHLNVTPELAKRDFCAMVVSNSTLTVSPKRTEIFHKLCTYKNVASGGRYLNNIGVPEGVKNKIEFQNKYKFTLALENTYQSGYVTEKLPQAFASKTVPIYLGSPKVAQDFNEKAFINLNNFDSMDKAIEYIKKVDEDDELYLEMLRTPALLDAEHVSKLNESLDAFLLNIVNQNYEKAFRRDREGRNKYKEDEYKKLLNELSFRTFKAFVKKILIALRLYKPWKR